MRIQGFRCRPHMVTVRLGDAKHVVWPLRADNLWDFTLDLEKVLNGYGIGVVVPKAIPLMRDNFRAHLKIQEIQIQDAQEFAKEHKERTRAGEHLAGGAWYLEAIINDTENCCGFNTLEDLFQLMFSICMREGAHVIAGKSETVPGLVGHG